MMGAGRTPPRENGRVPEALHLACDVVVDSFGHDSGLVCRALLRKGPRTLRDLVRDTVRRSETRRHASEALDMIVTLTVHLSRSAGTKSKPLPAGVADIDTA